MYMYIASMHDEQVSVNHKMLLNSQCLCAALFFLMEDHPPPTHVLKATDKSLGRALNELY